MTTGTGGPARRAAQLSGEGRIEIVNGYEIAYRVFGAGSRALLGLPGSEQHVPRPPAATRV